MPDRYLQAYRKMRRAGAKPRRADPRYNKPIVLTVPQATTMAAVLLVTGFFVRTAGYAALGLHPATSADIRLAALVRSAVPDVDTLAQDDIVARLSVPPQLGLLLAPLAATDPARASVRSSEWLDAIRSDPAPVTSPDRMRALGEVASGLAPLPADQRADRDRHTIIALYRATHDPSSRAIITAVGALPSPQRNRLADTKILQPILAAFATLPDNVLRNLQSDPDRLRLAVSIAGESPSCPTHS